MFLFQPQVDIIAVNKDWTGEGANAMTLRRGDLVEILQTGDDDGDVAAKYVFFFFKYIIKN